MTQSPTIGMKLFGSVPTLSFDRSIETGRDGVERGCCAPMAPPIVATRENATTAAARVDLATMRVSRSESVRQLHICVVLGAVGRGKNVSVAGAAVRSLREPFVVRPHEDEAVVRSAAEVRPADVRIQQVVLAEARLVADLGTDQAVRLHPRRVVERHRNLVDELIRSVRVPAAAR